MLVSGLGLLSLFDVYNPIILYALACLTISFLVRWLRTGRFLTRTGAELPLVLFLASAVLSTWAAYDRQMALLQLARFLGAAVAFYAVVEGGVKMRRLVILGLVLATALLGVYFVLHFDFNAGPVKFAPLTAFGRWLNANLPAVPGPGVHPNVAAGTLILGIPIGIALFAILWKQRRRMLAVLSGLMTLVALSGLLLTSSRGAWLALVAAFGLSGLVWIQRRWLEKRSAVLGYWFGLTAVAIVSVAVLAQTGILDTLLGQIPDPTGTLQSRVVLWQQSALLVRDYPLTGIGLLSFPMVFSTYTLMIHVPYIDHAHNTYLQVLIEQGWPGFLAMLGFGWVGLRWTRQLLIRKEIPFLVWGELVAFSAVILHGLVDVALYLERTLPVIGIVAGLLAAEYLLTAPRTVSIRKRFYIGVVLALLAGTAIFWKPLASSVQANLGAVIQTGLELRTYDPSHFDRPTLDQVRRSIELSSAQTKFQEAKALAANLTAAQRLAEIALSRGEYAAALELIQPAWKTGAQDQVTRLVYGDALVANGQPKSAADVTRGLPWAQVRIKSQAFYRYDQLGDYQREVAAWQAATLLDPTDVQAANGLADAIHKLTH